MDPVHATASDIAVLEDHAFCSLLGTGISNAGYPCSGKARARPVRSEKFNSS